MASKQKEDVYSDRSEYRRTEVCTSQVVIRRRVHDGVDCAVLLFTTFYRSHHGVAALLKFSMYQTILCLMISYNNVK